MNNKVIYKIESIVLITYLARLFFVTVIILMVINFKINPVAFSILSTISFILLSLTSTSHLFIYHDKFEIEFRRLFSFLNKKIVYKFEELASVEFSEGYYNPMNLIFYVAGTNKRSEFIINFKDNREPDNFGIIGSKSKALKALDIMNKIINKKN